LVPEIGCGYDDWEYLGSILVTAQKKIKSSSTNVQTRSLSPPPVRYPVGIGGIQPAVKKRAELTSEQFT
jgi:hypothetical protein